MNVNDRDQWQKDLAARINAADGDFKYEEDNADKTQLQEQPAHIYI